MKPEIFQFLNSTSAVKLISLITLFFVRSIIKSELVANSDDSRSFKSHTILIALQSFVCFLFIFTDQKVTLKETRATKKANYDIAIVSFLSLLTMRISYYAFTHMKYQALMLGTASKIAPLILMNFFIYKRKIKSTKIISILLTSVGILTFIIFGTKENHERINSLKGMILLIVNTFIENHVVILRKKLKIHQMGQSYIFMQYNLFIFIFATLFSILFTDELTDSVMFFLVRKNVFMLLIAFLFCYSAEQLIICKLFDQIDTSYSRYVNILSNFITIFISIVWYKKALTLPQWISLLTIFMGFVIDFIENKNKKEVIC